jgi:hypothetical protein
MSIKFTKVERNCYESYPCKHYVSYIDDDAKEQHMMIDARLIIKNCRNILDDELLNHFSYIDPSLVAEHPITTNDFEFIDRLKKIVKEKYAQKRDRVFDEFVKKLETLNIKAHLLKCVNEGFAGFAYFKNPYMEALTGIQVITRDKLIKKKLSDAGLTGHITPFCRNGKCWFVLDIYKFDLVEREDLGYTKWAIHDDEIDEE